MTARPDSVSPWRSLKTRVMLFTLIIFLISFWSLAFYISRMLRADMEQLLADQQSSAVAYVADDLNREFEQSILAIENIARSVDPSMLERPAALQAKLAGHVVFLEMFNAGVVVVTRDGTAVADFPVVTGRRGTNYASNVATQKTLSTGQSVIGHPLIGRVLRQPLFNINAPIRDGQGKVIGALFGVIDLSKPNFLDSIGEHRYGKSGGYLVVDPELKLIVTATDKSRTLQLLPGSGVSKLVDLRRHGFLGSNIALNSLGQEILSSASRIALPGWLVIAALPTEEAFAPIRDMQTRILWASLVLTLLAGVASWWLLRRQFAPLLLAVTELATRSNSEQLPQPLPITRPDEIGELIAGFNRLLETLVQREQALKEGETFKNSILNSIPAEIAVIDRTGKIVTVNQPWQSAMEDSIKRGKSTMQIAVGTNYQVALGTLAKRKSHRDLMSISQGIESVLTGRLPSFTLEYPWKTRQKAHWFSLIVTPLGTDRLGAVVFLSDSTEHKKMEVDLVSAKAEAERANQAKSRFLAAASHDLRQPLSALILYVGVLKSQVLPERLALVAKIQNCCNSLSELLTDLLDVSKLDAGVVTPKLSDFSVNEFLSALVVMHSAEASLKGVRLRLHDCGAIVAHTDHQLLTRIVTNLIDNAIRYTNQGGILLACRHRAGKQWIEVWDTGEGIPADKTQLVFEEFRQLEHASISNGSGLGLAIVAKTAALLGLQIRLRSRPGRGSMFAIELPLGVSIVAVEAALPQPIARPVRIGLVEDNVPVQEALVQALETEGHEVIAATSAKELMERLGQQAPDIIISDYRLRPGETGFEVIKAARTAFGEALPALIITGDTDPKLVRSMSKRGIAIQYKPLNMDALQAFISHAMKGRSS